MPPPSWEVGRALVMEAGHAATMLSYLYPAALTCESFDALWRTWLACGPASKVPQPVKASALKEKCSPKWMPLEL